jgi:hypothetical protein
MKNKGWVIFWLVSSVNLLVCVTCYASIITRPGSGPEGLGTALVALFTVAFSAILSGVGFKSVIAESRLSRMRWSNALASFMAAGPLIIFLLLDILRLKTRFH